jgi:LysR family transcriptional activator of nhaA
MTPLNYNHLYYFFIVAREGSIAKAIASLHLTSQTISGQVTKFKAQIGRKRTFELRGGQCRCLD